MLVEILSTAAQLAFEKACNRFDLEGQSRSLQMALFDMPVLQIIFVKGRNFFLSHMYLVPSLW